MTQQYNRFKDAPWFPKENETVMVGGAGGISSWLTLFLARAGFKPIVYDFDIIEEHNTGGQLFRLSDVGKHKVSALSEIIKEFANDSMSGFNNKIDENSPTHYFMFSGFDNMLARKNMFENWKRSIENCAVTPILIDGRLEMEQLQIFCVTPDRIEDYEKTLFTDEEVEDAPCTMKQTSHAAAMIATLMTAFFTNHMTNIYEREVVRDVPFYHEFFIPLALTTNKF